MKFFKNALLIAELCIIGSLNAKVADLIMALDPNRNEITEMGAIAEIANIALCEKAAPIIMSSNILEVMLSIRSKLGDENIQRLRTLIQTSTNTKSVYDLTQQFKISYNMMNELDIDLAILSLVTFDNNNFNCYFHNNTNLILIIPKQYIQTNFPNAINLSSSEQARACGFNPADITATNDFSINNLLKKVQMQQYGIMLRETFISKLTSLFIPNQQDFKWAIYLVGHGGPAISVRKPETAIIAGLSLEEFSQLMQFFNTKINVAFLHYMTCFGGGYNQTFVNEILSSLNVNFIASAEGIDDRALRSMQTQLIPNSSKTGLVLNRLPFTNFFKLLNLFIDKPEEFVKIKGEKKEPIAQILRTINPSVNKGSIDQPSIENQPFNEENQPFIRIPAVGLFGAISLDKNTKILTNVLVKAHELEKRPIDLSNTDTRLIIVNPSRVNVLLNLGKEEVNGHPAIALPTTKNAPSSYEAIHIFKEIHSETTLQNFLFHCIYPNARIHTQLFIINKLTGILCEKSGLPIEPNTPNTIHNLIIKIQGIHGKTMDIETNIKICFELNGNIYQQNLAIENFIDIDNVYAIISQLSFTSEPIEKTNMDVLANKFMTTLEVTKLKKPITLDMITKALDAKIDTQQTSVTKETQSQSGAMNLSNELISNFLRSKPKYSSKIAF
jgi:hypothetical protein